MIDIFKLGETCLTVILEHLEKYVPWFILAYIRMGEVCLPVYS